MIYFMQNNDAAFINELCPIRYLPHSSKCNACAAYLHQFITVSIYFTRVNTAVHIMNHVIMMSYSERSMGLKL